MVEARSELKFSSDQVGQRIVVDSPLQLWQMLYSIVLPTRTCYCYYCWRLAAGFGRLPFCVAADDDERSSSIRPQKVVHSASQRGSGQASERAVRASQQTGTVQTSQRRGSMKHGYIIFADPQVMHSCSILSSVPASPSWLSPAALKAMVVGCNRNSHLRPASFIDRQLCLKLLRSHIFFCQQQ